LARRHSYACEAPSAAAINPSTPTMARTAPREDPVVAERVLGVRARVDGHAAARDTNGQRSERRLHRVRALDDAIARDLLRRADHRADAATQREAGRKDSTTHGSSYPGRTAGLRAQRGLPEVARVSEARPTTA
jgi:hypothetical protein